MKNVINKLYLYLIIVPVLLVILGFCSNQAVLISNHGKFPVMLNEAEWAQIYNDTGDPKTSQYVKDTKHSIMGKNSHLSALADIFDVGFGWASLGDGLYVVGWWLLPYALVAWFTLIFRKLLVLTFPVSCDSIVSANVRSGRDCSIVKKRGKHNCCTKQQLGTRRKRG